MPGQFVLEGGRASVVGSSASNSREIFQDHVDPIKFVHNIFIDIDGSAEVWCELELGNHHDEPIRIDELHIGFNNIGHDGSDVDEIDSATTSYSEAGLEEVPLLMESVQDGDREKWHEMYDELRILCDDSPYFNNDYKNPQGNDRIFDYRLGPSSPHQHIYSVPVTFEVDPRMDGGDTTHPYIINKIRKLNQKDQPSVDSPILLPDETLDEQFSSESRFNHPEQDSINSPTRRDTISLWIYWEENSFCVPKDDISYHFRYAVDCDIQKKIFTRAYLHYILPDESVLMGRPMLMESLSEDVVGEFHPPEERWMFKEWEEEYNVRNMSSARMTRSKANNQDHIFNSGRIGFPSLRARHTALQFILVIVSGWAVQSTFSSISVSELIAQPIPVGDAWPLLILPVSSYLLLKGYGPPPFFPSTFQDYIVPTEERLLSPIRSKTSNFISQCKNILNTPMRYIRNIYNSAKKIPSKLLSSTTQNETSSKNDPSDEK